MYSHPLTGTKHIGDIRNMVAGVVRGLKKIKAHNEAEDAKFSGSDGPRTQWFKLADKQQAKVVFLQELDEDSPNFSKKNDLGILAVEHSNPKNYRRKALCTIDDGECWGCEQHRKDYKAGWKQKSRLYVNVLVDDGNNEPYVAILSQGSGPKSITPTLIEYAADDETITDKWFTIKRTGSGATDTSYTLRSGKASDVKVEDYELFDLNNVVRSIPYAEQEAHYLSGQDEAESNDDKTAAAPTAASVDAEW
jgi:hypothetical protein